jgi:hypothetical protein
MTPEQSSAMMERFEHILSSLFTFHAKCQAQCEAKDDIIKCTADLRQVFHDVIQVSGLYAQVSDVLRGLTERIRNLVETVESLKELTTKSNQSVEGMHVYFKIMRDRLEDYIHCPIKDVKGESHEQTHHDSGTGPNKGF